ncbi:MAG: DUF2997 domain-containing protein [Shewanella sp.]|nr:DUF2997 domain-containing protein [Shewanella sp.]
MKEVIIDVSARGEVSIEANGFQGSECTKATERIRVALNGTVDKDDKKPEFYAQITGDNHLQY